jgi:hypothetical protein
MNVSVCRPHCNSIQSFMSARLRTPSRPNSIERPSCLTWPEYPYRVIPSGLDHVLDRYALYLRDHPSDSRHLYGNEIHMRNAISDQPPSHPTLTHLAAMRCPSILTSAGSFLPLTPVCPPGFSVFAFSTRTYVPSFGKYACEAAVVVIEHHGASVSRPVERLNVVPRSVVLRVEWLTCF